MNFKIIDNFISDQYCDCLIGFFNHNIHHSVVYRDTFVFDVYPNKVDMLPISDLIKYINSKFTFFIKTISETAFINFSQIVSWPESSFQPPHKDFNYHKYTSILYLNDNFTGGETFINFNSDTKIVKPKKGRIVFFEGDKHLHGVNKVLSGVRYTVPTWYKNME